MRVAIVHYWLVGMRGGEAVVEALCDMFPDADVYTHVYDPTAISSTISRHDVRTTFIQRLPGAVRHYQKYLPLMPIALEQLDLREYDLVISSESGPAKGVITSPGTLHVCYCHSPMRYAWDMYHDYLEGVGALSRIMMRPMLHYLRAWDVTTAARVDHFVANSNHVASKIRKYYRRDAVVIHPPVNIGSFSPSQTLADYYLVVGQLVRYKRVDLAVEAFNQLGKPLVVIGDGGERRALERMAKPNVRFLGHQPLEVLREHYARCRALVFAGLEDFGLVPVEAMASGRPVLAYRGGGVRETVVEGSTGLFFDDQSADSVIDVVQRFERCAEQFRTEDLTRRAREFDRARFERRFSAFLKEVLEQGAVPAALPRSTSVAQ